MQPQLVLHLYKEENKKKPKLVGDYLITEKLDGIYGYIDYNTELGWGYIHSRQERKIPSLYWAKELFIDLFAPTYNFRLIFEITIDGSDFHTTNGILNRSVGDCQAYEAIFNLHDLIELDTYFLDSRKYRALARWDKLQDISVGSSKGSIRHVPLLAVSDDRQVWEHYFQYVLAKGGEGIVLKKVGSIYEPGKRNSSLMKMKLEEEAYIECVDIFYTVGKKGKSNMNITLRRKSGVEIVIRVGKHSEIAKIESDKDYILGKVVKIEAMEELASGAFREPRYKKVCDDIKLIDKRVI